MTVPAVAAAAAAVAEAEAAAAPEAQRKDFRRCCGPGKQLRYFHRLSRRTAAAATTKTGGWPKNILLTVVVAGSPFTTTLNFHASGFDRHKLFARHLLLPLANTFDGFKAGAKLAVAGSRSERGPVAFEADVPNLGASAFPPTGLHSVGLVLNLLSPYPGIASNCFVS